MNSVLLNGPSADLDGNTTTACDVLYLFEVQPTDMPDNVDSSCAQ